LVARPTRGERRPFETSQRRQFTHRAACWRLAGSLLPASVGIPCDASRREASPRGMFPVLPALRCLSHPYTIATARYSLASACRRRLAECQGALHCTAPRKRVVGKHGTEEVQNFPQLPDSRPWSHPSETGRGGQRKQRWGLLGLVWANLPPAQGQSDFCGTIPPLASAGPAALSIDRDHYYSSQMIPPWQWCHSESDCASQ
jgi:hypothetical protein